MLATLFVVGGALLLALPGGGFRHSPVGSGATGVSNVPPVCDAGPVQIIECNGAQTTFQLDGSASFDPDGNPLTFLWSTMSGGGLGCAGGRFDDPTSPTPIISFDTPACLTECGAIRLIVNDGMFTSMCTTALVAQDTLPPVCTPAPDVLELWTTGYPLQADPTNTGFGTGVDLCDPMVTMSFVDLSVVPGIPPSGIEQVITREWRADDNCGHFHTAIQTITFVGPSFFADSVADVVPGTCTNPHDVAATDLYLVQILGRADLDLSALDLASVTLARVDGLGMAVRPIYATLLDAGSASPTGVCPTQDPDGFDDAVLRFSTPETTDFLDLDLEPTDQVVEVLLTGTLLDGTPFSARDVIQVDRP